MDLFSSIESDVFTVSELTAQIKRLVTNRFRDVRVEGEVSNAKLYPSGHLYFTLKDDEAMLKAVAFNYRMKFPGKEVIKDGDRVICEGKVDVYEKRGEYQLIVSGLTIQIDQGNLYLKFLALKEKLFKEGLFDESHKKPLPLFPERIGIVTSPVGAAVRDMLRIIYGKFPNMAVAIYPVKVQGEEAAAEIVEGIRYLNETKAVDLIITGRGGGSLEDLAPFNEEIVARAIYASEIPVISAVGHEVDFTIADFTADVRAATPTAAADLAVRDKEEIKSALEKTRKDLIQGARRLIESSKFAFYQQATELKERKTEFFTSQSIYLDELSNDLRQGFADLLKDRRRTLDNLTQRMADLNPDNILKRGYSITQRKQTGDIILDSKDVAQGEDLVVTLHKGKIDVSVTNDAG